ncbi:MAG: gas vesicle protein GvpG [Candidatus Limnocylindria bacterium]
MFGLGKLLTLPYSLPAAGIKYCFSTVIQMAEQEMTDDTAVKEELLLLNMRYDEGEIDETEFRRQEAPLLVRFSEIRAYRKQLAEEQLAGLVAEAGAERVVQIDTPPELEPELEPPA